MVGDSDTTEGDLRATLWTSSGITDLNTVLDSSGIGWILDEARDINDSGQIVGFGRINGQPHAVLLTFCDSCESVVTLPVVPSVPEPETYGLMLTGLAALLTRTRLPLTHPRPMA